MSSTLSPNARNGILCANAACTTNTTVTIDPRIVPYLPLYPLPNGAIRGDVGQFITAGGKTSTEDFVTGKFDYQHSSNTALAGSYAFDRASFDTPDPFDQKQLATQTRNQRAVLSLQHVFSPTVLNTIRTGFNRNAAPNANASIKPKNPRESPSSPKVSSNTRLPS